ncbi:hypothetical protein, partial [Streptomyces sp. NPDC057199]|uniref:hypothetical protein n=1 Tax=Streptomyces sp. NPDC057199 TaxID=3346047 RepID=UPI0036300F0B
EQSSSPDPNQQIRKATALPLKGVAQRSWLRAELKRDRCHKGGLVVTEVGGPSPFMESLDR